MAKHSTKQNVESVKLGNKTMSWKKVGQLYEDLENMLALASEHYDSLFVPEDSCDLTKHPHYTHRIYDGLKMGRMGIAMAALGVEDCRANHDRCDCCGDVLTDENAA